MDIKLIILLENLNQECKYYDAVATGITLCRRLMDTDGKFDTKGARRTSCEGNIKFCNIAKSELDF